MVAGRPGREKTRSLSLSRPFVRSFSVETPTDARCFLSPVRLAVSVSPEDGAPRTPNRRLAEGRKVGAIEVGSAIRRTQIAGITAAQPLPYVPIHVIVVVEACTSGVVL